MANNEEELSDAVWKNFLRNHWKMTVTLVGAAVGAAIGGVLVFLWRVSEAQATDMVPALLGEWTVGYAVTFVVNVILWEFLLIGIPAIAAGIVVFFQWWKKLPEKEKWSRSGAREESGGGAISLLVFLTWLVIVWVDGRWNLAFQAWSLNDWVYSWLAAFLWDVGIIGIPVTIGALWWLHHKMKEEP